MPITAHAAKLIAKTTFWWVDVTDVHQVKIVAEDPASPGNYVVEFSPPKYDGTRYDRISSDRLTINNDYYSNQSAAYKKLIQKTEKFLEQLRADVAEMES